LNEEALDRTMWRARFGRSFGPIVRLNDDDNWREWSSSRYIRSLYGCGHRRVVYI